MLQNNQEFVLELYRDITSAWAGKIRTRDEKRREKALKTAVTKPFDGGRDPHSIAAVLTQLTSLRGWDREIAEAEICRRWEEIVGPQVAARTKILYLEDGVITVQAQSQTWVTELRRLRGQIVANINDRYGAAKIVDVQVLPPQTVSWKHGSYAVKGRGPRDTYDWA
ncbi:DUF721 domain-containing protein [Leucobacter sp. OH2974_COT-288]|nr:DUF721 domain-containing protein [Leucobacter sp. OH2974_COT-288]